MSCDNLSVVKKPIHIQAFDYRDETLVVTQKMKDVFQRDGVIIIKKLFSGDEVDRILNNLENNPILDRAFDVSDGDGRASRLLLWNQPGNDITGMVARCEKVVNTCQELLGDEVYHYHTKLMMKEAKFGGKQLWHQDYGYWYKNGCLTPDMMTVFIPLDMCKKENGCLQVIPGTNRCGRIDHDLVAGQTTANQKQVDMILERFSLVYAEVEPGDGLFFHSNVLHRSDRNESDSRRWAFLVAYNTKTNNPMFEHHCPRYTPLHKVPNDAIMKCDVSFNDFENKDVLDPSKDHTIRAKLVKSNFH